MSGGKSATAGDWPEQVAQLKQAIDASDCAAVADLMTRDPALHAAPLGYGQNGPLTWAAECRGTTASPARLAIVRWMLEHGSDVHQGGDGPLMRAALSNERTAIMELLVEHGANVNALWKGSYPIVFAPCETLQPRALEWLIAHGADPRVADSHGGTCIEMLLGTYCRNPAGKAACLEVFAQAGFPFPDTAPMAVHRGRIDLLADCLRREPGLLERHWTEAEIYPPQLMHSPGLHGAPLEGATLLHLAVEFEEEAIVRWLLDQGADANARSAIDAEGFGGQTALFHTAVALVDKTDRLARLLLSRGADPHLRATLRTQLREMGDPGKERMREFHQVTAAEFARQFQEPGMRNPGALAAMAEKG